MIWFFWKSFGRLSENEIFFPWSSLRPGFLLVEHIAQREGKAKISNSVALWNFMNGFIWARRSLFKKGMPPTVSHKFLQSTEGDSERMSSVEVFSWGDCAFIVGWVERSKKMGFALFRGFLMLPGQFKAHNKSDTHHLKGRSTHPTFLELFCFEKRPP